MKDDTAEKRGIGAQTFNFYLQSLKQFCRWMHKFRRAHENPVSHLDGLNVRTDRRHDRRALTVGELVKLLDTAYSGPVHFEKCAVPTGPRFTGWLLRRACGPANCGV